MRLSANLKRSLEHHSLSLSHSLPLTHSHSSLEILPNRGTSKVDVKVGVGALDTHEAIVLDLGVVC